MYDELVKRLRHSEKLAERGLITPRSELCAAADVRPVVRGHNTGNARIFECSECGYGFDDIYLTNEHDYPIDPNFCPNCGADMRKEPPEEET